MTSAIRAVDTAITLSLSTSEFLSLLSENVEIAQGIFRMLLDRRGHPEAQAVLHGEIPATLKRKVESGLQAVDRILLLQSSTLFKRATAAQLVRLTAIARPVTLKPGEDPLTGAESCAIVVLSGSVRVERGSGTVALAEAGDGIGFYETLGGVPVSVRAEVVATGQALRFSRSEILDLLADDIDLLQGIFSGLLRLPAAVAA
jgi:CRP-like cAMP-binding protein